MKRFVSVVLSVMMCLSLCACGGNEAVTSSESPSLADEFAAFLDGEGFVYGLSQGDFLDILEKYSYNGEKVTDLAPGLHYDGLSGGGISGYCDFFRYSNDYTAYEDYGFATYTNTLKTEVDLEGLTLPYGITLSDDLESTLKKLNHDIDIDAAFDYTSNTNQSHAFFKNDRETVELVYSPLDPFSSKPYLYSHLLRYVESYTTTKEDGRQVEVERTVRFSFNKNDLSLAQVEIAVTEKIERK